MNIKKKKTQVDNGLHPIWDTYLGLLQVHNHSIIIMWSTSNYLLQYNESSVSKKMFSLALRNIFAPISGSSHTLSAWKMATISTFFNSAETREICL